MANAKITALSEDTTPDNDDLTVIVDDVAGTPTTKKATLSNVVALARPKTSAHASPPSSPAAGDLWMPYDSFYVYRYSGSVWVPWGPVFPMTPPVNGDFSWVNQGSSAVDATYGGIHLTAPAINSENIVARVKSAPATPYTITAAFLPPRLNVFYMTCGMLFRESGTGELHTFGLSAQGSSTPTGWYLFSTKYDSPTVPNSNYLSLDFEPGSLVWMQITDNGTNRILRFSADGQHWTVFHTVGRTDFLTANQVGFFCNSYNVSWPCDLTLLSWKESA